MLKFRVWCFLYLPIWWRTVNPTDPFTIGEPLNPPIDVFELHKVRRSRDIKARKLKKDRSGTFGPQSRKLGQIRELSVAPQLPDRFFINFKAWKYISEQRKTCWSTDYEAHELIKGRSVMATLWTRFYEPPTKMSSSAADKNKNKNLRFIVL